MSNSERSAMKNIENLLSNFGISPKNPGASTGSEWTTDPGEPLISVSPVDGKPIAQLSPCTLPQYDAVVARATQAALNWRTWPAPRRGEVIRQIGQRLREEKAQLGQLVSYEMGKSLQEGLGEVQEMIDIADFALGLSRQLYGRTMHSERPSHRMYEQWHPLGVVGIISAFNFPVAVWSWNAFVAWVCGNACVWKPSEKAPLSALACQRMVAEVFEANEVPEGVSGLIIGDASLGQALAADPRVALVSATGSTAMGKSVATTVAARLGKSLLELGGNNAMIITAKADLDITIPACVFGAVGTAGQRCTTTRRLIIESSVYETVKRRLKAAYDQIQVGNPLDERHHMGPLIDEQAVSQYMKALTVIEDQGGRALVPGGQLQGEGYESGCYVKPCIYEVSPDMPIVETETFAPILYIMPYEDLEQAIHIQNQVPQGLSSTIMTTDLREAETFLSAWGSDCGIANVNIGTSGAEIGGAFGGEKETGGGRESGSDAWKAYMRRQTNTINWSDQMPLAQGIRFSF